MTIPLNIRILEYLRGENAKKRLNPLLGDDTFNRAFIAGNAREVIKRLVAIQYGFKPSSDAALIAQEVYERIIRITECYFVEKKAIQELQDLQD